MDRAVSHSNSGLRKESDIIDIRVAADLSIRDQDAKSWLNE